MAIKRAIKAALREINFGKVEVAHIPAYEKSSLLHGQLALVSGGSSGIGLEISKAFASAGCAVVIGARSANAISESANLVHGAKPLLLDVTKVDELPSKVEEAAELFPQLAGVSILVNCAGISSDGQFGNTDLDAWNAVIDVNLRGSWFLAQAAANHMVARHISGNILNVSSSSALRNAKTPYEVSKWGVKGMTLGMAELMIPHGIVVNAIGPGPTATPLIGRTANEDISHSDNPSGRLAVPQEIAHLALVLVSDYGRLVVGDTLYVTGGAGTVCIDR